MQSVLITGGAGYIGSVLSSHLLAAGYRVTVLDNLVYGQSGPLHLSNNPNFQFVYGDANNKSIVKQLVGEADVLIPLAALVGAPVCQAHKEQAYLVNLAAVRLIESVRENGQFSVFPTTNSGYGTQSGDTYCTESTPLKPISVYGRTKVRAESLLLGSPNTITLRLATVFGMSPRMRLDLLVNDFTYRAFTDGYLVLYEPHFKRNYVHIRDVADCFIHCIKNHQRMIGNPYNVGLDSANCSKEELALKIKEHLPKTEIYYSESGTDPDKRNYIVSNQRLRDAGFEASRDLDMGIEELIKGYRMLGKGMYRNA
jgi:nucleoside-diphosphate-sugar epimerase